MESNSAALPTGVSFSSPAGQIDQQSAASQSSQLRGYVSTVNNKSRPRVYISGPISRGDQEHNFNQSIVAQRELIRLGFSPLNPMLTMKFPGHESISHQEWIDCDLPWVEMSNAVLRLPGESIGADMETDHAKKLGIPVFESIESLVRNLGSGLASGEGMASGKARALLDTQSRLLVIGLHGYPTSGKDECAKILAEITGGEFERVAFADPVKQSALACDPIVFVHFSEYVFEGGSDGGSKTQLEGYYRLSWLVQVVGWTEAKKCEQVRRFLQKLGTEGGRDIHGQDCWCKIATRKINDARNFGKHVVATDVRFDTEIQTIQWFGGEFWKVTRPGVGPVNNHKSENQLPDFLFTEFITNDGGLNCLREKVSLAWERAKERLKLRSWSHLN